MSFEAPSVGNRRREDREHDERLVAEAEDLVCALAAEACLAGDGLPAGTVGLPPVVDPAERVLREGYIVAPAGSGRS